MLPQFPSVEFSPARVLVVCAAQQKSRGIDRAGGDDNDGRGDNLLFAVVAFDMNLGDGFAGRFKCGAAPYCL